MTDRQLKKALKMAYQPPEANQKAAFLRRFSPPGMTATEFIRIQAGFICRWNWLVGAGIFLLSLLGAVELSRRQIWVVSALVPFMAASTVAEMGRSARWGMDELELATRFSLKAVTLARLSILGLGNLALLALLSPVMALWVGLGWLEAGVCILCPYCLAAFLSLWLVRRLRGPENTYACLCASALVSGLYAGANRLPQLALLLDWRICMMLLPILVVLTLRECTQFVTQTEEYVWN